MRDRLVTFADRLAVPAAGAAMVSAGTVDIEVVGVRRRHSTDAATVADQWHIGSCGKSMTAALYARLVELGLAEWGTPVRAFFPDLAGDVDTGWSIPNVDDLLHCRSGMAPNLGRRGMLGAWRDERPLIDQRTDAVLSATAQPPHRHGVFRYSNLGYVVVGAAIDRLTGTSFEDALRRYLLDPLGIASAGFGPPPSIWGHRSRIQIAGLVAGRGTAMEPADVRSDNPAVLTPAGRLHVTLADWAKFQRVFLAGGEPILGRDSVEHLLRMPPSTGKGMAMGWAPARGEGLAFGMQGSNTMWSATALIDASFQRTAMVVANDGRTRVLARSARLAAELLRSSSA